MLVKEITDREFLKEVEQSETPVVAEFQASWCGPCQIMGPIVEKIAETTKGAKFVKMDVDQSPKAAGKYGIMSIPTTLIFNGGKVKDQVTGVISEKVLKEKIKRVIA